MDKNPVDLRLEGNNVVLNSGRLELFTPQNYVDTKITMLLGREINVMGLMNYRYYKRYDSDKITKQDLLRIPSTISSFPSDIQENVQPNLYPDSRPDYTYTMLTYEPGDIIYNQFLIKNLENTMTFTHTLLGGRLDANIPYNIISVKWLENILMNDVNMSVPITVLDGIVSEIYRDRKDTSKTFAQALNDNPNLSLISYAQMNARNICGKNSVFAALTFEDMNAMIDSSISMTREQKHQKISPLEEIIKL